MNNPVCLRDRQRLERPPQFFARRFDSKLPRDFGFNFFSHLHPRWMAVHPPP